VGNWIGRKLSQFSLFILYEMLSTNGPYIAMPLERVVVVGYLNLGMPQNAFKN